VLQLVRLAQMTLVAGARLGVTAGSCAALGGAILVALLGSQNGLDAFVVPDSVSGGEGCTRSKAHRQQCAGQARVAGRLVVGRACCAGRRSRAEGASSQQRAPRSKNSARHRRAGEEQRGAIEHAYGARETGGHEKGRSAEC